MARRSRGILLLPSVVSLAALTACSAPQTTVDPRSDLASDIHSIYVLVFWLGMAVFIAILALTVGISIRYRERAGRVASNHARRDPR